MSEEKREYTIYKLYCKDPSVKDVYIGKTVNLKQRKREHKSICNNPSNGKRGLKKYVFIRKHDGISNWDYKVLEKVYGFKRDAENIETKYIKKFKSNCLNSRVSFLTEEERKEAKNKLTILRYHKNPEKYREKQREAYYKDIEKSRKRCREDYKKNGSVKIFCNYCSANLTKDALKRHQRTIKCKTAQLTLPFNFTLHKLCDKCNKKILIKDESFMHNCEFEIEDDNKLLKKKRKL